MGKKKPSSLEVAFMQQWKLLAAKDSPYPTREFRFHPTRMWRFDFAWPAYRLAVELEGGVMSYPVTCDSCKRPVHRLNKRTKRKERVYASMGRHTRASGFQSDCEKYNEAAAMGYRVLRFTIKNLTESPAEMIKLIQDVLSEGPIVELETQGDLFGSGS